MALDKEYFDSIDINIVRQKYYNANKVNSVLEDIRRQAEAMTEENRQLKEQLSELGQGKSQIGDTLLTAQAAARDIVAKAKIQAAKIVAEAQQQREDILTGVVDQQEYAADCVRKAFDKIVHQQLESIELLNGMWQEFLCGLVTAGEAAAYGEGGKAAEARPRRQGADRRAGVNGEQHRPGTVGDNGRQTGRGM